VLRHPAGKKPVRAFLGKQGQDRDGHDQTHHPAERGAAVAGPLFMLNFVAYTEKVG